MRLEATLAALLVFGGDSLGGEGDSLETTMYDAALECAGGEVGFGLRIERGEGRIRAFVLNGEEEIVVPVAVERGDRLRLGFDYFDSEIEAMVHPAGVITGEWRKRRTNDEWASMHFSATPGGVRTMDFQVMPEWVAGRWRVKFAGESDDAVAVFGGGDRRDLRGTFLTTTGDYRFLAGVADAAGLTLSCFDGSHAFLFKASRQADGSLKGDFWSGASYHDTWTAVKDAGAVLPDPFGLTRFTGSAAELDALEFSDVSGVKRRLGEFGEWKKGEPSERDASGGAPGRGRARIIEVFGTWCPNCLDATRLLSELDETYRERGLSVVGLAFEVTGDVERDRKQVALYAARHGVRYPLLVAGKKDKAEASEKFPVIDRLRAYPTFVFVDGAGVVRGVYTGFSGPATGEEHERLRRAFVSKVEEMLGGG